MLAGLSLATAAYAGGSISNTTVSKIEADGSGQFIVYFAGTISGGPSCAASETGVMAVDGTTASGKVEITAITVAYAMGKTLIAHGTGTCTVLSNEETLSDFLTTD
jgi:hypothetical protein